MLLKTMSEFDHVIPGRKVYRLEEGCKLPTFDHSSKCLYVNVPHERTFLKRPVHF